MKNHQSLIFRPFYPEEKLLKMREKSILNNHFIRNCCYVQISIRKKEKSNGNFPRHGKLKEKGKRLEKGLFTLLIVNFLILFLIISY